MNNNIFHMLLRDQYARLPEVVQRFHDTRLGQFDGQATVKGANNWLARVIRKIGGFPPPTDGEVTATVRVIRSEVQERWLRQFGDVQFSSAMNRVIRHNLLRENFGMFSCYFSLAVRDGAIHWQFERWDFAGLPMPGLLDVEACESAGADGRYEFAVKVEMPLVGVLIDYSGSLA